MENSNDETLNGGYNDKNEPVATFYGKNTGGIAEVNMDFEEIFQKYKITKPQKFYFEASTKHGKTIKSQTIEIVPPSFSGLAWMKDGKEIDNGILNDDVMIYCDTNNMPEGKEVDIEIWENDHTNTDNHVFDLKGTVHNNRIETLWRIECLNINGNSNSKKEIAEKGYTIPKYDFIIRYLYFSSEISPVLNIKCNFIEIAVDNNGNAIVDTDYILITPDGQKLIGKTDKEGYIKQNGLYIGKCKIIVAR